MKKKTVPAILIHLDWIETIKCLSHEQIGAFIIAMLDYANTGKEPSPPLELKRDDDIGNRGIIKLMDLRF